MGISLKNLVIDWDKTIGGNNIQCVDVQPYFLYDESNRKTDILKGFAYTVIVPKLKFEKLTIKIEQKEPAFEVEEGESVPVSCEDLAGKVYLDFRNNNEVKFSLTASDIKVVE